MPPVSQAFARTMGTLPPLIPKPEPVDPEPDMPIDMEGVNPAPPSLLAFAAPKKSALAKFDPATASPEDLAMRPALSRLQEDEQKDLHPWGTEENHPGFWGKLGHAASVATGGPNRRKYEEMGLADNLRQMLGSQSEQGLQAAQTSEAQMRAKAGEQHEVSPQLAAALGMPELEGQMLPTSAIATLEKQHGINTQRQTANELTNQTRLGVANVTAISREKIAQLKPEQRDDRAIAINQKLAQGQDITPEEQSYLKAYGKYIDQTKTQPGVARMMALGEFRPVQALNPETGQPEWNWSGQAVGQHMGTTANVPFRTAAGMAKFMTSGKGGQTITAYNTANDHLELLGKAMDALQNGDVQGLNQLSNSFRQQFGAAAPTNVNTVKAMLAGELANVAKVTGATDQEIKEQQNNINRADSPEQIKGFIDTNHELMDQKAYEMYQQYQQGMQGQPAFNTGLTGRGPQHGAGERGGGTTQTFSVDGTTYHIPANLIEEFKKDHPNAR